jgi:PIN domain nuclease of toxin-antitoxin system
MKLLLDAHVLLWYLSGDSRLNPTSLAILDDDRNAKWVSTATLWEIAIKVGLGKIQLGQPFEQLFPMLLRKNEFGILDISIGHLSQLLTLPGIHKDPFDRILVAQAASESLTIMTTDTNIAKYSIPVIW